MPRAPPGPSRRARRTGGNDRGRGSRPPPGRGWRRARRRRVDRRVPRHRRHRAGRVVGDHLRRRDPLAATFPAFLVTVEAPVFGSSLNPARSFGPALASGACSDSWIYAAAPHSARCAVVYRRVRGSIMCAKLFHTDECHRPFFGCRYTSPAERVEPCGEPRRWPRRARVARCEPGRQPPGGGPDGPPAPGPPPPGPPAPGPPPPAGRSAVLDAIGVPRKQPIEYGYSAVIT